jgi:hypothetical protein
LLRGVLLLLCLLRFGLDSLIMMFVIAVAPMPTARRTAARRARTECENVHHNEGENDRYGSDTCGDGEAAALGERSINVSDDENHTGYEQDTCENQ